VFKWSALNDKIRPKPDEGRGRWRFKVSDSRGMGGVKRGSALDVQERWRLGWCSKRIPMHRLERWRLRKEKIYSGKIIIIIKANRRKEKRKKRIVQ
jgi:hypothetical protein